MKSPRRLRVSVREIALLKRLQCCKIFVELKRFYDLGISESAVLVVVGGLHPFPAKDAHHEHGRIEMERPFVFSTDRERSNACDLTFFHRIDQILPVNDLCRVNTGFLTKLLFVPK